MKVVGSNPTQGSNFSLKKNCLGIWFALSFSSILVFIMHMYIYVCIAHFVKFVHRFRTVLRWDDINGCQFRVYLDADSHF